MTDNVKWLSVLDHPPQEDGWYATIHCWDENEGAFPGAHYWAGQKWEHEKWGHNIPIGYRSSHRFVSQEAAEKWAYDHDPEEVRSWPVSVPKSEENLKSSTIFDNEGSKPTPKLTRAVFARTGRSGSFR